MGAATRIERESVSSIVAVCRQVCAQRRGEGKCLRFVHISCRSNGLFLADWRAPKGLVSVDCGRRAPLLPAPFL